MWLPNGWHTIVENLCDCIDAYVKTTCRFTPKITNSKYYFWIWCADAINWVHTKFLKWFPRFNKWEFNKPFCNFESSIRRRSRKHCESLKQHPPEIEIDQIKEKFGELRFYYSGGDDQIRGMVYMAEYLCSKTCEVTGKAGTLCVRNGWYKTLSPEILEQDSYKGYKPAI